MATIGDCRISDRATNWGRQEPGVHTRRGRRRVTAGVDRCLPAASRHYVLSKELESCRHRGRWFAVVPTARVTSQEEQQRQKGSTLDVCGCGFVKAPHG